MIFTRLDRLIIDDLPIQAQEALRYFFLNQEKIAQLEENTYKEEGHYCQIKKVHKDQELPLWTSYQQMIILHIWLFGEEVIDVNDIDQLKARSSQYSDLLHYDGVAQSRLKAKQGNVLLLFPESATRFHYVPNLETHRCIFFIPLVAD